LPGPKKIVHNPVKSLLRIMGKEMARKVVSENPTGEQNRKMSGFCICILQTPTF